MRLSVLVLAFALVATAASAQAIDPKRQQAVNIAIDWIEKNTRYKQVPMVGHWVELSGEQMAAQAVRGHVFGDPHQVSAIYSCGADTLYFRNDVNFYDVAILSLLVHELTHHAQCLAHVPMNDTCAVEREAYRNQQAFVRALPARLAAAGSPPSPALAKSMTSFAADIDRIITMVCQGSAVH